MLKMNAASAAGAALGSEGIHHSVRRDGLEDNSAHDAVQDRDRAPLVRALREKRGPERPRRCGGKRSTKTSHARSLSQFATSSSRFIGMILRLFSAIVLAR